MGEALTHKTSQNTSTHHGLHTLVKALDNEQPPGSAHEVMEPLCSAVGFDGQLTLQTIPQ